jgi:thiopurine S-methyltransferase
MEAPFWHERWAKHEIGFHMPTPHAALERYWRSLQLAAGSRVFVPLAGKSLDLVWLARAGYQVVGIELSPVAVAEFRAEHPSEIAIDLRCGDFFDLTPDTLGPVDAIFDRASLVALPPAMRSDYVAHITALSKPATQTLLVTMEYDQCQMRGPPHAVLESEVQALYGARHDIETLERIEVLADYPRMIERGVTALAERVYRLTRH